MKPSFATAFRGSPFEEHYQVLSSRFRIRSEVPGVDTLVGRFLAPFRAPESSGSSPCYEVVSPGDQMRFGVVRDGRCVHRSDSLTSVADFLLWEANTEPIGRVREYLVVHAGAVSWRDRGLVLPAPADHGKTTLTAGLTSAGFSYLSDEAALIDPATGHLRPYPRALWFEPPTLDLFPEVCLSLPAECRVDGRVHYQVSPDDLRPGAVGGTCRIRYVIAPRYAKGSDTFLEPISKAAGVHLLARNAFNFEDFGLRALLVLAEVVRGADCYRLSIGDLSEGVALIEELVRSDD